MKMKNNQAYYTHVDSEWYIPAQFPLSSFCVLLEQKQSYEPMMFIQMDDEGQS
jgi:hypothetical protein